MVDEMKIWQEFGRLQGRIEALERQVAELEARPAVSAPTSGKEKKWHAVGEVTGTITHAARGLDKNKKTILVLWNATAGRRINVFLTYEKKIDWTAWFSNELKCPINSLPLLDDIKGNNTANMVSIKHFILSQTKKEAEGEQYPKYDNESVAFPPTGGQTNHAPQPATPGALNLFEISRTAWERWQMPEEVVKAMLTDVLDSGVAMEILEKRARLLTNDNYKAVLDELYGWAFEVHTLSEAQVKQAMEWANDPKDTNYVFYPAEKGKRRAWHWYWVVELSVDRLRKDAAKKEQPEQRRF